MKNTKRVEAGDIPPSFVYRVGKKIVDLEKRRNKYLLNFWVVAQKLSEIQLKINTLRKIKINTLRKTKKQCVDENRKKQI